MPPLLSVDEALAAVVARVRPLGSVTLPLEHAFGRRLAEDVVSDIDSPPFDKSLMDGYALRASDAGGPGVRLELIEEVTAGRVPARTVGPGQATQVMTGAPLPAGADAVVPVELTRRDETGKVVLDGPVRPGSNVMCRGTSMRRGDLVLREGTWLGPAQLGALAEMGLATLAVARQPRVAVLATGDELVPVGQSPAPGQIRNSNETMLCAQVRAAGAEPVPLGIARDRPEELDWRIAEGLQADVLVLSGGVSAGRLDLVPAALERAGVAAVFHKVNLKPGKPLWFGVAGTEDGQRGDAAKHRCLVFGLPGNPVSSMVCFEVFVRTALLHMMGETSCGPRPVPARLEAPLVSSGERPVFHPARMEQGDGGRVVRLVSWSGSADLRAIVGANALVMIPSGDVSLAAGELVSVLPLFTSPSSGSS